MEDIKRAEELSATPYSNSFADNLLRIALDIGEGLLKSGGEIHRVETTVERICLAYGASHIEVFSIQSLILAAVRMPDGSYSSQNRRIATQISTHMLCLESYNSLSRQICAETPDFSEVDAKIKEIKAKRQYPLLLSALGNILAAGGFTVMFGGSWRDTLAATLIGLIISAIDRATPVRFNNLAKTLFLALCSGMLTCLSIIVGLGESMDIIAIGTIMLLVPGLYLGNAMVDLLSGDTLTGTLKTVQACITAVMIAIGYALAIVLLGGYCPHIETVPKSDALYEAILLLSAAVGSLGFCFIFKSSKKRLVASTLGGFITFAIFELSAKGGAMTLVAAFLAALFMTLYSQGCAKLFRAPAIVFLFPCAIPIVPGGSLYYTIYNLLIYNEEKFNFYLRNTAQILLGMTLGVCLASIVVGIIQHIALSLKKKK